MATTINVSETVAVAMAKGAKSASDKAAKELEVGDHEIEALVKVTGFIRKGADKDQVVHMAIPHWKVIGALLSKVNKATRNAVLKEAIQTALNMDKEQETQIKSEANEAIDQLKGMVKKTVSGNVTCHLNFEEITENIKVEATKIKDEVEETEIA